ncbi:autotransporter outer membrane beta-barrel domain-containing protein [Pseudomonas indica]|uniref:autotransporter outer membrane beta-barrel domain-containing protein n=1 Tax=Pseudomonas indica TaxID=137658 RepID=UPI003FCF30EE
MPCLPPKRVSRPAARHPSGYLPQATGPEASTYPRKTLAQSISVALLAGLAAWPSVSGAVIYDEPITGVANNDRPGGTGGYDPAYALTEIDGVLHYTFANGDSVALEGTGTDVLAVSLTTASAPVALDNGGSQPLSISAVRKQSGVWGLAIGIDDAGTALTVNGDSTIRARADDSSATGGGVAIGVRATSGANIVFNGTTSIDAFTPGKAQGIFTSGGSTITFNGPTHILAQSRETLEGVYNSNLSTIIFNGDTTVLAHSIWPSDNAHGIYNDNVGSRLTVNGNLTLESIAQGSTAFGIRNQGILTVTGDSTVNVSSPRSAFGVANTHWRARMNWDGDLQITVRGGSYVPFGNPSGISNDRTPGAQMDYNGAVSADVLSAAVTYGITNTGDIRFNSTSDPVSFTVASTCSTCDVYGFRNLGSISVAGDLNITTSPSGTGNAYSLWSVPLDTQNASITVNQNGGHSVQLDGHIVTATSDNGSFLGSVDVNFDTANSFLAGLAGGWQSSTAYSIGRTTLAFSNGARWIPQGTGTMSTDFGSGSLTLGDAGMIDMASYWGTFAPSSIPSHSYRTLLINSTKGATVALNDDARFRLLSDITGASGTVTADKIVFGSGITGFSATGTQGISIAYDPVLDDVSWVNASTISSGTTIQAASPITIVDASAAAGGTATFAAATGLARAWSGTYENNLVSFSYAPQVSLSADGRRILLTGIVIGSGGSVATLADNGAEGSVSSGVGTVATGGNVAVAVAAIRPAETVLTAADAADSLVNLWSQDGQASAQHARTQLRSSDAEDTAVWVRGDAGELDAKTAYSRDYSQRYNGVTAGADRRFTRDGASSAVGVSFGQTRSNANYEQGKGELSETTLGLYSGWAADGGPYVVLGADASMLENRYSARDSVGRHIAGKYRTPAARVYADSGYPFRFSEGYYIEPQLGLSVGAIRGSEHTTRNGVKIEQDGQVNSVARAGVEVGRALQGLGVNGGLYARASALRYMGDDLEIEASQDGATVIPDTADRNGTGSEFVLGGDIGFGLTSLYLEASEATGVDTKRNWAVQAGLRHSW